MKAIVLGATGAVGSNVTRQLLAAPAFESVTILTRKHTEIFGAAPKLQQRVMDLDSLETQDCAADAAFCTIGVGQPRKAAPGETRKVEFDYTVNFAKACKKSGVKHFSLMTAVGADTKSMWAYSRLKGEIEEAVRALGFARLSFFRPSLLVTPALRYGMQDAVTQFVFPKLSIFLPAKLHEIRVEDLGKAMVLNALQPTGPEILYYQDCKPLLGLK